MFGKRFLDLFQGRSASVEARSSRNLGSSYRGINVCQKTFPLEFKKWYNHPVRGRSLQFCNSAFLRTAGSITELPTPLSTPVTPAMLAAALQTKLSTWTIELTWTFTFKSLDKVSLSPFVVFWFFHEITCLVIMPYWLRLSPE